MFFKGSRYEFVAVLELIDTHGRSVKYKGIRFIPETPSCYVHTVQEHERPDQIAQRYLRDPQKFWRICDANLVLWPDDLTAQAGRSVRIPRKGT